MQKLAAEKIKRTEATMAMNYVGRALHYPRGRYTSDLREGPFFPDQFTYSVPLRLSSATIVEHCRAISSTRIEMEPFTASRINLATPASYDVDVHLEMQRRGE
jgi:hypothetical protein